MRLLVVGLLLSWALAAPTDPLPGSRVNAFELSTRDAQPYAWKPGRVTVLSFFAFWCDTWKVQSPRLAKARGALSGLPIDVLTVTIDGRWTDVPGFDPTLPCLLDHQGWAASIGVDRVPTTLVLDRDGIVRWSHSGVVRTEDLVREAKAAMAAKPDGTVSIRIEGFSQDSGGFKLLDELRRLDLKVTLELAPNESMSVALAEQVIEAGDKVARVENRESRIENRASGPEDRGSRIENRIDPYDETRPGVDELVRRVLLTARPGVAIIFHAGIRETVEALPRIAAGLRRSGLRVAAP